MNWKVRGKKWSWSNHQYYPGNCLKGLRKTSEDNQGPSEDLKWPCSNCNLEALSFEPTFFVIHFGNSVVPSPAGAEDKEKLLS